MSENLTLKICLVIIILLIIVGRTTYNVEEKVISLQKTLNGIEERLTRIEGKLDK
jgi:hypothetical protein